MTKMVAEEKEEYQMSDATFYRRMVIFMFCVFLVFGTVFYWDTLHPPKTLPENEIILPSQFNP